MGKPQGGLYSDTAKGNAVQRLRLKASKNHYSFAVYVSSSFLMIC